MIVCPATCRLCFSLRIQTLVLRLYEERVIEVQVELEMHFESSRRRTNSCIEGLHSLQ